MNEDAEHEKVAIVTGASRGIGASIATELAIRGYRVVINYQSDGAGANATARAIRESGGTALEVRADVRSHQQLDDLFTATLEKFHRLDVLVNNAGVSGSGEIEHLDDEVIERTLAINLKAVMLASQRAVQCFGDGGGSIVNVSSMLAMEPLPGESLYAASKAGVDAMTRVLAQELGPRGIRVNAVAPGCVETDLLKGPNFNDEVRAYLANRTALRRIGQPSDIAPVVAFLVSETAAWVTGQVIAVDGGLRV